MQLFLRYHYHKIYKLFHTEFWLFESSIWLHTFARSMISIFIPILLLRFGYSITEVLMYYLIFNIFDFPLNFFAKWTIQKIGAKRAIILGILALVGYFAVLYNMGANTWHLLILMAILAAFYDTWYWGAHIYYFMKCSPHDDNVSRDASFLYIVKRVAGILAPIIGAVILIFVNQQVLIIFSVVVLLLSLWPLFKIKDIRDKPKKERIISAKEFFKTWDDLKEYIMQGICSFHNVAEGVIWPIFIYSLFKSIESVAVIPVIVSLTAIAFIYFTGKIKKGNRARVMALGSLLVALVWILRLFIVNDIFLYASIFLVGLFSIFVSLPLESNIFEKGEKKSALATSIYRNTFSMFPRIFFYGVLILLLEVFKVSFIAAAVAMFIFMVLSLMFVSSKSGAKIKDAY